MCDADYGEPELVWGAEIAVGDLIARNLGGRTVWHRAYSVSVLGENVMILVETGEGTEWVDRGRSKRARVRRRPSVAST